MIMKKLTITLFAILLIGVTYAQDEARLLRFPAIHGDQIVFTYAGDLYTVAKEGGVARKLTNDSEGYEMFARFSPDGTNIAFTGQYDGNTEVFLIPSEGGLPVRLTYTATLGRDDISDRMGPNNIVMTWRDNSNIVYRSRKQSFNSFKGQLFLINKDGGLSEELPLPVGGFCSYSPDKTKLAYNRVFREFRTWKYYRGGMADDIWVYDFKTKKTENLTNNPAQDIFPMWRGEKIYFCSDRDRTMNLFVIDLKTKETRKLTNYTNYDVKFPSMGDAAIIYENGGYLYLFDLETEQSVKIDIRIANDFITGRDQLKDASKIINSFTISPDGKRLGFDARGDIFTVPVTSGITKDLTRSSGVHDRDVAWSPDGKYLSFVSDKTGEDEIYIINQDGSEPPVQFTKNADTYKYFPIWSPDSKKLLWSDKMLRLQYVDIDTKEITIVAETNAFEYNEYTWSPDSKWIAFTEPVQRGESRIFLYELASKKTNPVTDGWYDVGDPAFSSDGKYLFFTSNRDFNPIYSWTEWNHAYNDMSNIYFLTLAKSTPSPFAYENDEVSFKEEEIGNSNRSEAELGRAKLGNSKDEGGGTKDEGRGTKDEKKLDVKVDLEGIMARTVKLPLDAGIYWGITALEGDVYYVRSKHGEKPTLCLFNLKDKKETDLGEYGNYEIASGHKKMVLAQGDKYAVIDLPKSKISVKDYVDLSNMKIMVDLQAEWNQIFNESWRQMKYFFYAPNMHGLDWDAIREKYAPLVSSVNNRNDLNYIIGEMVGELNVGHAYVSAGDKPKPKRIKLGLLGAAITRDKSGYYRIDKILQGENWSKKNRSPLTELGVDVSEGDYIIAINGISVKEMNDIYQALVNKAGVQVELTVNGKPTPEGAHKTIVVPVDDEADLYYYNWVQENIRKVNEATNGEVGYIHIPDMGPGGLNEFVKYFYPQLTKRALIIDDRGNGGGNVSPMIIERLKREAVIMRMARNTDPVPGRIPFMWGPKICLIDQYSASDGDLFPYQFKQLNLGKLVGTRTWGGVIGIRGTLPFIDGGSLQKPEFANYDFRENKWAMEGVGVEPDVWVDNDPAKEYAGEDEQLNKAIELILVELEKWPKELPEVPEFPDKTK
ncbi:MAG: PD40 domain-containing protein [Bacteroidales bacterium]|nr:PD40 domain-containing protein [Bacteroidales bacterium]